MILDKKQMREEDIKLNYIRPALNNKGWRNGENIMRGSIVSGDSGRKEETYPRRQNQKIEKTAGNYGRRNSL